MDVAEEALACEADGLLFLSVEPAICVGSSFPDARTVAGVERWEELVGVYHRPRNGLDDGGSRLLMRGSLTGEHFQFAGACVTMEEEQEVEEVYRY